MIAKEALPGPGTMSLARRPVRCVPVSEYIGTGRWAEHVSLALTSGLRDLVSDVPGAILGAACIDQSDVSSVLWPGETPFDGRFELASITKTMTGILLALLAGDGALQLDDPVGTWLDAGLNSAITLRQLATHTSGLPENSPSYDPADADPLNPWAAFDDELAQDGLRQAVVDGRGEPAAFVYSNFGYQLLGLVLEHASGSSYAQLIAERLFDPLGIPAPESEPKDQAACLQDTGKMASPGRRATTRCQAPAESP